MEGEPGRDEIEGTGIVRRHSTVLSVDVCNSVELGALLGEQEEGPELLHEIMEVCVRGLERAARRHGAGVFSSRGDGGIASFGIPVAFEETTRAAVNAAIDMLDVIDQIDGRYDTPIPVAVRVGIASGIVRTSDFSASAEQVTLDLSGETTNLAARLQSHAPSRSVFVSKAIFLGLRDEYRFEERGELSLKGFPQPIPAYELLSRKARPYRDRAVEMGSLTADLVDRVDVRRELTMRMESLSQQGGAVFAISGALGVGKTRVIREVWESKDDQAFEWQEGRCFQMGTGVPYHPFRDLLRRWARIVDDESTEAARRVEDALTELLPEPTLETLGLLMTISDVSLRPELQARIDVVGHEHRWNLMYKAVYEWFAALAAEKPLVVVLDDLQWADTSSLELIQAIAPLVEQLPVLLVLVYRPERDATNAAIESCLAAVGEEHRSSFHIDALNEDETRLLLEQLIGGGQVPDHVREELERLSAGNPFVLEEFLHDLVGRGVVTVTEMGLSATQVAAAIKIPGRVNEALMARIDRLPAEQRNVIELASVVGHSFYVSILLALFEDADALTSNLEGLVGEGLLVRNREERGVEYGFRHSAVQEVAYESIGRRKRRALHLRIAETIESDLFDSPEAAAMLAYHYGRADRLEAAEEHLFRAGERAARVAASEEQAFFFRKAAEVIRSADAGFERDDRLARIDWQLAQVAFNQGRLHESSGYFLSYLARRGYASPKGRVGRWALSLRTLLSVVWEVFVTGEPRGQRSADPTDLEVIQAMMDRARAETQAGVGDFVPHSLESFSTFRRFDPRSVPGAGGIYASAIGIFTFAGIAPTISDYYLRRGESLSSAGDPKEQMLLQSMRFFHHFFLGDWRASFEIEAALVQEALEAGSLWDVSTYLGFSGKQFVHQGRFEEARSALDWLQRIENEYSYRIARENRLAVDTLWHLEKGDFDAALDRSRTYLSVLRDEGAQVFALGVQAKVLAQREDLEAAEQALARAERLRAKAGFVPPFQISSMRRSRLLVGIHRELDAPKTSRRVLASRIAARRAIRASRRAASEAPEVMRVACEGAWIRSGYVESRRLDEALEAARRLRMAPEEARILLLKARVHGSSEGGADAGQFEEEARRIASRLDLRFSPFEERR